MINLNRFAEKSLRVRILILFFSAISLVTLLTLFLTRDATFDHSTAQLEVHHRAAYRVVNDRLATRATLLRTSLADLSSSFSVKELVASGSEDPASLLAAMENYRSRLDSDVFLVLDGEGRRIVGNLGTKMLPLDPRDFASPGLTWFSSDGKHYLLKAAPLRFAERSRNVNAWLLMGQRADRLINDDLVALTGMQISVAELSSLGSVWGSTLDADAVKQLESALPALNEGVAEVLIDQIAHVVGVHALPGQNRLFTLATLPRDEAYLNYRSLLLRLGSVLLCAMVVALLAALRIANSISRPIDQLVEAANHISEGRAVEKLPRHGTREVRVLSRAIDDMQHGIREREQEIHRLAFFDDLTALPNRNSFTTELTKALDGLRPGESVFIVLIDIDRFSEINDAIGHSAGDRLLKLITQRLKHRLTSAHLLARMGGDEFALIFFDAANLKPTAKALAEAFEQPFFTDGVILSVDASAGFALAPEHADDAQGILHKADIALYSCKEGHEPFKIYADTLKQNTVQRLELMAELKTALSDGQVSLHYQPKLNLKNQRVESVECLIRWQHPRYGMLPPDEFIGLAEQTGAIRHVTRWALEAALEQRAVWASNGQVLSVAVNISALDLVDMSLPAFVGELQSRYDLQPGDLTLEVTESAVMNEPESAILALKTLDRMGVYLSIDDFGTGFSSLAQLKKMPVRELKIDKAFVLSLASSREDQAMVKTVLSLAENLDLSTVAEGVEDESSLQLLRSMGCTRAQGFYLSRPLAADAFDAWLAERSPLRVVGSASEG